MNNKIFSSIKRALDHNAPTIATFGSIVSVIATIYFMHRASERAARVEYECDKQIQDLVREYATLEKTTDYNDGIHTTEFVVPVEREAEFKEKKTRIKFNKIINLAIAYRYGLLCGFAAMFFAFLSNYLNGMQIAGLGTVVMLNRDKFQKGEEKLKELLGEEKFKAFQENLEKDIIGEQIVNDKRKVEMVKRSKDNDILSDEYEEFCVPQTGEIYKAPRELVEEAIDYCTKIFENDKCAYLDYNTWRAKIRIPSAPLWSPFVWTAKNPFKARIGQVNYDGRCMNAIIFDNSPSVERSFTR